MPSTVARLKSGACCPTFSACDEGLNLLASVSAAAWLLGRLSSHAAMMMTATTTTVTMTTTTTTTAVVVPMMTNSMLLRPCEAE